MVDDEGILLITHIALNYNYNNSVIKNSFFWIDFRISYNKNK